MLTTTFVIHASVTIVDAVLDNFVVRVHEVFLDVVRPCARGLSAVHHTGQTEGTTLTTTFLRIGEPRESVVHIITRGVV
jgi:hypothetical protein